MLSGKGQGYSFGTDRKGEAKVCSEEGYNERNSHPKSRREKKRSLKVLQRG